MTGVERSTMLHTQEGQRLFLADMSLRLIAAWILASGDKCPDTALYQRSACTLSSSRSRLAAHTKEFSSHIDPKPLLRCPAKLHRGQSDIVELMIAES